MDPNETLKIMRDESLDISERQEASRNLINWVGSGGYLPATGYDFGGNTATKFVLVEECRKVLRISPTGVTA